MENLFRRGTILLFLVLFCFPLLLGCPPPSSNNGPTNTLPAAAFAMNKTSGEAPLIVQFEDKSSPGTSSITSWSWSFGDSASGSANTGAFQNPGHTFNNPGTYSVKLTVNTAHGSDSVTKQITVTASSGLSAVVSQDIRVVDEISTMTLDSVSGSDYTFTYSGNGVTPIQQGDILVGTDGDGYLRRVSSVKSIVVKKNGTKTATVATEFCSLNEAVETGTLELDAQIQFTEADFEKSGLTMAKEGTTLIDLSGITLYDANGLSVTIPTGTVDFAPAMDVAVEISGWEVSYAKAAGAGTLSLDFSVLVEADHTVTVAPDDVMLLPPVKMHFAGSVGPIPVKGAVELSFAGGLSVAIPSTCSVEAGFISAADIVVGGEFTNNPSPTLTDISSLSLNASGYGPVWTYEAVAHVRIYVKPQLQVSFYGVAGPFIGAEPYVNYDMQVLPTLTAAGLTAGFDACLDFPLGILSADWLTGTWELSVEGPSYTLFEWTDEPGTPDLTADTTSVSLDSSNTSATVTVSNAGDGTLSWTVSSSDPAVTVTPSSYTGNSKPVTISIDDFTESHTVYLTFTNYDDSSDTVNVTVSVTGNTGGGPSETETIMLPGNVPLEMVRIEPGTFLMGRYSGEQDSTSREDPRHQVTLTQGFWMGKYELTKAQWEAVMGTAPWSGQPYVLDDPNSPAVYVSWNNSQAFIAELNSLTGKSFRLPTEAEWEYTCRAGTTTRFYWGG